MAKRSPLTIFLMLGAILAFFIGVALLILPVVGKKGILAKTNKVGVVEIIGVIADSKTTLKQLKRFRENDAVQAVVYALILRGEQLGLLRKFWKRLTECGPRRK